MPSRSARLALLLVLPAACSGPPGAGRQRGDDLGGFRVQASELSNGCGAGALGSRARFEFEIDLSREYSEIFWGRAASGALDAALGFEFAARVSVPVSEPSALGKGCVIGRADRIVGALEADASGEVLGFSAQMLHTFDEEPSSACSLDDRIAAGLPRLPCEMAYALSAERYREPGL
jgi:hypothetical protein